tara:strand:- start:8164 stop:8952 length:789 start_codon:yes stop_codon:yes gene_type:complete
MMALKNNFFLSFIKHCFASFKRRFQASLTSERLLYKSEVSKLKKEGIFVKDEIFISKSKCNELRNKIDNHIASGEANLWQDDLKSDNRFYFAENLDSSFKELFENEYIRGVLKGYTGFKNPKGLLLAARLDYKNGNIGSGGGWHRDSPFSHQFKAVCYLSNVDEKSGPFQIFKKTHLILNIFKLFVMSSFKLDQYRYANKEAENFKKATGSSPTSFLGDEGKLAFIDTKALHRGKPIASGSRYVIFWYFWENSIPKHFEKYR